MKIFCIGRNYAAHAKEMKSAIPERPVVFMKPATALLKPGQDFYYPEFTSNLHYECELVIRIGKNGKHIKKEFAHKYLDKMTLGIDFTARDLQAECKKKGHPWEIAKGFDNAAPISDFYPLEDFDRNSIEFKLWKNEELVQHGNTKDLIFSFDHLVTYVSQYFRLQMGDLIFTGTPAGVGPVQIGDTLKGALITQAGATKNVLQVDIR